MSPATELQLGLAFYFDAIVACNLKSMLGCRDAKGCGAGSAVAREMQAQARRRK
jgi:hypothetical protein